MTIPECYVINLSFLQHRFRKLSDIRLEARSLRILSYNCVLGNFCLELSGWLKLCKFALKLYNLETLQL